MPANINNINPNAILRYIVAIHFVLTSILASFLMVLLTAWLPMSYILNQIAIIVLGLWSIVNRESVIQVELLMVIKFLSIILDVIAIGMYFELGRQGVGYRTYFSLSAFFAILLLILKPIMLLLLNKVREDRVGDSTAPTFGGWSIGDGHSVPGYQPVDVQPVPTHI